MSAKATRFDAPSPFERVFSRLFGMLVGLGVGLSTGVGPNIVKGLLGGLAGGFVGGAFFDLIGWITGGGMAASTLAMAASPFW